VDVRTSGAVCTSHDSALHHVHGVSARVLIAIAAVEHRTLPPGAVRRALRDWERLARLGVTKPTDHCGEPACCGDSPRDLLEEAIALLPPRAKKHLRRLVRRIDQVYLARTWPDPDAASDLPG
jgi:hypothetical protein